ncbi:hypothetical protein EVJ50_05790 [Synechococcus sp. RSCCF101]|uniref:hypothetical protein n=1 Tax=Synechococcus sp. RSCCF101 TaxID=2511069 RepID=UPI0012486637|nr:hypothetical protein [Synechococcus sp. RSCCF101]QEY31826.1 hypothetical protein EVJ50_05790 [Synechococcus sp. RSCCF101]
MLTLLHLHGFKCAGSTLIWALEHSTRGTLLQVESPGPGDRLDWHLLEQHLAAHPGISEDGRTTAASSHLITLPPPGRLARLHVALLRRPLARILSAYRFQREVQHSTSASSFADYVNGLVRTSLANYQTRHLSPQEPIDWQRRRGWAARPELIDLERPDLVVGLVERYDESMVVIEHALEALGQPLDLAYPEPQNRSARPSGSNGASGDPMAQALFVTELDLSLHERAEAQLNRRIAAIEGFPARLAAFRERCGRLAEQRPAVRLKPRSEWLLLSPTPGGSVPAADSAPSAARP